MVVYLVDGTVVMWGSKKVVTMDSDSVVLLVEKPVGAMAVMMVIRSVERKDRDVVATLEIEMVDNLVELLADSSAGQMVVQLACTAFDAKE